MAIRFETFTKNQVVFSDMPDFRVSLTREGSFEPSKSWTFDSKKKALVKYYTLVKGEAARAYKAADEALDQLGDDDYQEWKEAHEG